MSSTTNTSTGAKPADPYKAKNIDEAPLKEKVEELSTFITSCKFGMMTTRDEGTGKLVSRCMALADTVRTKLGIPPYRYDRTHADNNRKPVESISSS